MHLKVKNIHKYNPHCCEVHSGDCLALAINLQSRIQGGGGYGITPPRNVNNFFNKYCICLYSKVHCKRKILKVSNKKYSMHGAYIE